MHRSYFHHVLCYGPYRTRSGLANDYFGGVCEVLFHHNVLRGASGCHGNISYVRPPDWYIAGCCNGQQYGDPRTLHCLSCK